MGVDLSGYTDFHAYILVFSLRRALEVFPFHSTTSLFYILLPSREVTEMSYTSVFDTMGSGGQIPSNSSSVSYVVPLISGASNVRSSAGAVPMPSPRGENALEFRGRDIDKFLEEFEFYARRAHLSGEKKCRQVRLYFQKQEKRVLNMLRGYQTRDWDILKAELRSWYPLSRHHRVSGPESRSSSYALPVISKPKPTPGLCRMCAESCHAVQDCMEAQFLVVLGICYMDGDRVWMTDGSALPQADGEGGIAQAIRKREGGSSQSTSSCESGEKLCIGKYKEWDSCVAAEELSPVEENIGEVDEFRSDTERHECREWYGLEEEPRSPPLSYEVKNPSNFSYMYDIDEFPSTEIEDSPLHPSSQQTGSPLPSYERESPLNFNHMDNTNDFEESGSDARISIESHFSGVVDPGFDMDNVEEDRQDLPAISSPRPLLNFAVESRAEFVSEERAEKGMLDQSESPPTPVESCTGKARAWGVRMEESSNVEVAVSKNERANRQNILDIPTTLDLFCPSPEFRVLPKASSSSVLEEGSYMIELMFPPEERSSWHTVVSRSIDGTGSDEFLMNFEMMSTESTDLPISPLMPSEGCLEKAEVLGLATAGGPYVGVEIITSQDECTDDEEDMPDTPKTPYSLCPSSKR